MQKDPYRRIAKRYDFIFQSMNEGLIGLGLKFQPPVAGMSVLDVGFGSGTQLSRYQKAGCLVWGIDSSAAMFEVAQKKLGSEANLHLGDATKMPYENEMFDLITSTLVIHEMSPQVRASILVEMKRVLKKNGRILLIDFHPGKLRFPVGWVMRTFIILAEFLAGRDHFRHFRDFMRRGGVPDLISNHELHVEKSRIVSGGNMALTLLSKEEK